MTLNLPKPQKAVPVLSEFDYSIGSFFCCHIKAMLNLCAALESIADGLPRDVDRALCRDIARVIRPMVDAAHQFEEQVLFPSLSEEVAGNPKLAASIERLRNEHREDEDFCLEIADALTRLSQGDKVHADQLGYMLRGFFEGMRRHIACEKEFIFPLLAEAENQWRTLQ